MSDATAAILFLMVVGVIIVLGILVGIIVAGRMDRLMAPRPKPAEDAVDHLADVARAVDIEMDIDVATPAEKEQP